LFVEKVRCVWGAGDLVHIPLHDVVGKDRKLLLLEDYGSFGDRLFDICGLNMTTVVLRGDADIIILNYFSNNMVLANVAMYLDVVLGIGQATLHGL
jgi:hypothetical protein